MKHNPKSNGVHVQMEGFPRQKTAPNTLLFICVIAAVLWFALGVFRGMAL